MDPFSEVSLGGAKYFLTFKDEVFGFRTIYLIKHKSDVFEHLKIFDSLIRNQFGHSMKLRVVLRIDDRVFE